MRTCEVEGCDKKHHGKGMCNKHFLDWRRNNNEVYACEPRFGATSYKGTHDRLRLRYGSASKHDCSICFEKADAWAFIKEWCPEEEIFYETKSFPRGVMREVAYSLDDAHYLTLCKAHHNELDRGVLEIA